MNMLLKKKTQLPHELKDELLKIEMFYERILQQISTDLQ